MPSEAAAPGRWAWLRSQGLGLACGQATVLLLGVGTVVLARTADGASAGVQLDDLTVFFKEPSAVHAWLYALFPVTALYALNTALCTWDAAVARWRRGGGEASAWAPTVIHLAFLLALLAHGVGGFWNHDEAPVTVAGAPVALDAARTLRLVGLGTELTPSGKVKQVHARVEVVGPGAARETAEVGYNQPLSSGLGSELLLLAQVGRVRGEDGALQDAVVLRHRVAPGHPIALASALTLVVGLLLMGRRWW